MTRIGKSILNGLILGSIIALNSCNESEGGLNVYENWKERNATWFVQVADSAAADPHHWRKIKSYTKIPGTEGALTEYIFIHDLGNVLSGSLLDEARGKGSPAYSDSAFVSFQGKLLKIKNMESTIGAPDSIQEIFTSTWMGRYDDKTCAPVLMGLSGTVPGFATALQNMIEGDHWLVYIPQILGYGSSVQGAIPAYSTLQFELRMHKWYRTGSGAPAVWK